MKLEGYTPEVFLENFIKDCEVFGEETTQAIYEEVFSAICNKKITLDNFFKNYNYLMEAEEEMLSEAPMPSGMQEAIAYAEHAKNMVNILNEYKKYIDKTVVKFSELDKNKAVAVRSI